MRPSGTCGAAARIALLLPLVLALASSLRAQQVRPTEYQVKAAYLYNFGLFVSWPVSGKSSQLPFSVCVLGKDPFGPVLDSAFAGDMLDGRATLVRRIANVHDAHSCGILFVSRSEAKNLESIFSVVDHASILTVSDIPDFARKGGMIEFVWQGDNVRFEVNLEAADSAGLALSSDLLKVAAAVRKNSSPGD